MAPFFPPPYTRLLLRWVGFREKDVSIHGHNGPNKCGQIGIASPEG